MSGVLQIIPAGAWWWNSEADSAHDARRLKQERYEYGHHRLFALALVEITDTIEVEPETWRVVKGICPLSNNEDDLVPIDECCHESELACLGEDGRCHGHYGKVEP